MIKIDDIVEKIIDCSHSTPKWSEKGFPCVRTTEFKPFRLNLNGIRFVNEKTYEERIQRLKPRPGDVLYSREGAILGIACQIPTNVTLCMGQRMMLFRCDEKVITGKFLTAVLNSDIILSKVRKLTTGTASPHLNVRDIKNFEIPIPPLDEQNMIISILELNYSLVDGIINWISKNKMQLTQLKYVILNQAFNGELIPQDPNDEPAEILLRKVKQEREKLQETQRVIKAKPIKSRGRKNAK